MTTVKSLYISELIHNPSNKIMTGDFIWFWRSFVEKKYFADQSATMKVSEQAQTPNLSLSHENQHLREVEYLYKPPIDDVGQFNKSIRQFIISRQSNPEQYCLTNHSIDETMGSKILANNTSIQMTALANMTSETSLNSYRATKSEPTALTSFFEEELKQPATKDAIKITVLDDSVELYIRDAGLSTDALKNQLAELKFLVKQHFNVSLVSVSLNGQKLWDESHDLKSKNNTTASQYDFNESSVFALTDSIIDKTY